MAPVIANKGVCMYLIDVFIDEFDWLMGTIFCLLIDDWLMTDWPWSLTFLVPECSGTSLTWQNFPRDYASLNDQIKFLLDFNKQLKAVPVLTFREPLCTSLLFVTSTTIIFNWLWALCTSLLFVTSTTIIFNYVAVTRGEKADMPGMYSTRVHKEQ